VRIILLFSCLAFVVGAHAQTAPKVVFTGDYYTQAWQQTPQFTANTNWIGAGVSTPLYSGSSSVLEDFQVNVIDQHPAFVHILTGDNDISGEHDATPLGVAWHGWEEDIVAMVEMARKADIKVILGNIPSLFVPPYDSEGVQFFNAWLARYGLVNNIPVVNYHDALCECVGLTTASDIFPYALALQPPLYPGGESTPNATGWQLMTQMAQIAIATYDLTIKSGYLSNAVIRPPNNGAGAPLQQNSVVEGTELLFIPQAKWSDGIVRPMVNQDFNGLKGAWISSNPAVMTVNQQGQAYAYSAGTATISFTSASGVKFSPWVMTVSEFYGNL
jgi:hypothetical protein